ncbi:hypothetical protein [Sphingomicrobium nitratireducens]|uniref:hypothetical protein n=1 Tax=Sphingomicrobium nitratireducens TaxID=2964666 RepID=UPI0022400827|nr:hypothetical protein [Sphingomicrobium nitratireducens]
MLKSLGWMGAAGIAAIMGLAMYSGGIELALSDDERPQPVPSTAESKQYVQEAEDAVDDATARVNLILDNALSSPDPVFAAQMEAFEPEIEAGTLTRQEAITRALEAAMERAPDMKTTLDDTLRTHFLDEADAQLEQAHEDVDALLEAGRIERSVHDRLFYRIDEASDRISEERDRGDG